MLNDQRPDLEFGSGVTLSQHNKYLVHLITSALKYGTLLIRQMGYPPGL